MARKVNEYFDTKAYLAGGPYDFKRLVRRYLENLQSPNYPVSVTNSVSYYHPVSLKFTDDLYRNFVERDDLAKPYDVAMRYGFRGFSRGGKDGIFLQRGQDRNLLRATESMINSKKEEICKKLGIEEADIERLRPVKIVWHSPSGERVVGVYDTQSNQVLFLGFANY